jgi:hypothetical protein
MQPLSSQRGQNDLLAALPEAEYRRLQPGLTWIEVPTRRVPLEPRERMRHVSFPLPRA